MSSCAILDLNSGASLLPHVYCNKITLQNHANSENDSLVNLHLQILFKKNTFKNSALYNTIFNDKTIKDFLTLQMVPFQSYANITKLLPSNITNDENDISNVYIAHNHPKTLEHLEVPDNKNYLPQDTSINYTSPESASTSKFDNMGVAGLFSTEMNIHLASGLGPFEQYSYDYSIPIGDSEIFNSDELSLVSVSEVIINGDAYYSLDYSVQYLHNSINGNNLGFLFYCFLDVPAFLENSGLTVDQINNINVKSLVGPVNTEIVLIDGQVVPSREQFFTDDGEEWNGSVHLHTAENPDLSSPSAPYFGDGSKGVAKGWMAGLVHQPAASQPKLNLFLVPNTIVEDLRFQTINPPETVMGLTYDELQKIRIAEKSPEQLALKDVMEYIISPFQQETKKYLAKFDSVNSVSLYDNDTEYSKLYITRDVNNAARGIFLIDFIRLLSNNSVLFSSLIDPAIATTTGLANDIFPFSRLIELKVFRDRINKKLIGNRYENYSNDTLYEEPSHLIGTLYDGIGGFGDSKITDGSQLEEISLAFPAGANLSKQIRCFAFTDQQVSEMHAGHYQYRVEFTFKDGTHDFLNGLYKDLVLSRNNLQKYHNLSQESFCNSDVALSLQSTTINQIPEDLSKNINIPYYENGVFNDQFILDAQALFAEEVYYPWKAGDSENKTIAYLLAKLGSIFSFDNINSTMIYGPNGLISTKLLPLMNPTTGSPEGINIAIKITDSIITHLEKLLGLHKLRKAGSALSSKIIPLANYNLEQLDFAQNTGISMSSANSIIKEEHSFDHPSEIFKAIGNKEIYMDYISSVEPISSQHLGPIRINTGDYRQRAILEANKFVKKEFAEKIDQTFVNSGLMDENTVFFLDVNSGLSDTGYQYLSPSIIKISDAEKDLDNFYSNGIKMFAQDENGQQSINNNLNLSDYEETLISLVNYSLTKKDISDADILKNYQQSKEDSYDTNILKEVSKDIFSSLGLAVYDADTYDGAFNKSAGALSPKVDNPEINKLYNETVYNDKENNTEYYKNLVFDADNLFINVEPIKNPTQHNEAQLNMYPNFYKIRELSFDEIATERINNMFLDATVIIQDNPGSDSFFFINSNLLCEVQVYDTSNIGTNLKNDNDVWRLLQKSDIDNIPLGSGLLCKFVLYDAKNSYDLELPIINQVFIMNGTISAMSQPVNQIINNIFENSTALDNMLEDKLKSKTQKILKKSGKSKLVGSATKVIKDARQVSPRAQSRTPASSRPANQPAAARVTPSRAVTRRATTRTRRGGSGGTRGGGYSS